MSAQQSYDADMYSPETEPDEKTAIDVTDDSALELVTAGNEETTSVNGLSQLLAITMRDQPDPPMLIDELLIPTCSKRAGFCRQPDCPVCAAVFKSDSRWW